MKRIKIPLLLLLVALGLTIACKGEIEKTAKAYLTIEQSLIAAHEAGSIDDATWANISKIRNEKGKPAYRAMLEGWRLYGTTKKPEDYQVALDQAKILQEVIKDLKQLEGK